MKKKIFSKKIFFYQFWENLIKMINSMINSIILKIFEKFAQIISEKILKERKNS